MTTENGPQAGVSDDELLDEFRGLVREAFDQARDSGKLQWNEMTSAVLKNRLLNIPGKPFSQERYGSPSFINLVRRIPDVVEIISNHPPFLLRLQQRNHEITEESTSPPAERGAASEVRSTDWRGSRIRADLWRAIVDYSSGNVYVFDSSTGEARHITGADADLPQMPTITSTDFAGWRREFLESISGETRSRFNEQLEAWANRGGSQADLPRQIRGRWNEFVKGKVISILDGWFEANEQERPADMLVVSDTVQHQMHGLPREDARNRELRELVLATVRKMTYAELAALPLPAAAILRASGRMPSSNG